MHVALRLSSPERTNVCARPGFTGAGSLHRGEHSSMLRKYASCAGLRRAHPRLTRLLPIILRRRLDRRRRPYRHHPGDHARAGPERGRGVLRRWSRSIPSATPSSRAFAGTAHPRPQPRRHPGADALVHAYGVTNDLTVIGRLPSSRRMDIREGHHCMAPPATPSTSAATRSGHRRPDAARA